MSINAQECLLADSSLFITNFWLCYSGIIHSKPLEDQVTKSGTLAGNMQQLLTYKALRQPASSQLLRLEKGRGLLFFWLLRDQSLISLWLS